MFVVRLLLRPVGAPAVCSKYLTIMPLAEGTKAGNRTASLGAISNTEIPYLIRVRATDKRIYFFFRTKETSATE